MESESKDDTSVLSDTVSEDTADLTNRLAINLLGTEELIQATATANRRNTTTELQVQTPTALPVLDTDGVGTLHLQA